MTLLFGNFMSMRAIVLWPRLWKKVLLTVYRFANLKASMIIVRYLSDRSSNKPCFQWYSWLVYANIIEYYRNLVEISMLKKRLCAETRLCEKFNVIIGQFRCAMCCSGVSILKKSHWRVKNHHDCWCSCALIECANSGRGIWEIDIQNKWTAEFKIYILRAISKT